MGARRAIASLKKGGESRSFMRFSALEFFGGLAAGGGQVQAEATAIITKDRCRNPDTR